MNQTTLTPTDNFLPLSIEDNASYTLEEVNPSIAWEYTDNTKKVHHWSGYIRIPADATYTISANIDDNGYIEIAGQRVLTLDGHNSVQTVQGTITLAAGYHKIVLHHEDWVPQINYANAQEFTPKINNAPLLIYKIGVLGNFVPESISVEFTEKSVIPVEKDNPASKLNSYCASGSVFLGTATVQYVGVTHVRTFDVQSGGWMNQDSPFYRDGDAPSAEQVSTGAYNPADYPDTTFPSYPEQVMSTVNVGTSSEKILNLPIIKTERSGLNVDGFRTVVPDESGRSSLFLHAKERYGSEGCVSTDCSAWEEFCSEMKAALDGNVGDLPFTVSYVNGLELNTTGL